MTRLLVRFLAVVTAAGLVLVMQALRIPETGEAELIVGIQAYERAARAGDGEPALSDLMETLRRAEGR